MLYLKNIELKHPHINELNKWENTKKILFKMILLLTIMTNKFINLLNLYFNNFTNNIQFYLTSNYKILIIFRQ